jgi:hypothetical protein
VEPIAKPTIRVGFYIFRHIFWTFKLKIEGNNLIKIKKEIVLKKIKEFFLSIALARPKAIICWTIAAIGFLTLALLLTGCGPDWNNLFSDVGPAWSPDGSKIAIIKTTDFKEGSNWGDIWVMDADGSYKVNLTDILKNLTLQHGLQMAVRLPFCTVMQITKLMSGS